MNREHRVISRCRAVERDTLAHPFEALRDRVVVRSGGEKSAARNLILRPLTAGFGETRSDARHDLAGQIFAGAKAVQFDAIAFFSGSDPRIVPYTSIMAAGVIITIPLVIVVLLFQRRIISGLTAGGVKG